MCKHSFSKRELISEEAEPLIRHKWSTTEKWKRMNSSRAEGNVDYTYLDTAFLKLLTESIYGIQGSRGLGRLLANSNTRVSSGQEFSSRGKRLDPLWKQ